MKTTTSLGAGLISTKGMAAPTADSLKLKNETPVLVNQDLTQTQRRTTVTVKLNDTDYQSLKMFSCAKRKSNQDIIVDSLKEYIAKHNAEMLKC